MQVGGQCLLEYGGIDVVIVNFEALPQYSFGGGWMPLSGA
jgi:hypothetical protein